MTAKPLVRHRSRADFERALDAANQNEKASDDPQPAAPHQYEIGYGKPPKAWQFKKGQSGNPKGRPKGSKNVSKLIEKEASSRVTVRENGRERTITKLEASIKRLMEQAIKGNIKALHMVIQTLETLSAEERAQLSETLRARRPSRDDMEILKAFVQRRRVMESGSADEDAASEEEKRENDEKEEEHI